MKLLRYGPRGQEKPGLLDRNGKIRDLSGKIGDLGPASLAPAALDALRKLDPESLPLVAGTPRIGPCVADVPKLVCVGLNYRDHAAESGMALPPEPVLHLGDTVEGEHRIGIESRLRRQFGQGHGRQGDAVNMGGFE